MQINGTIMYVTPMVSLAFDMEHQRFDSVGKLKERMLTGVKEGKNNRKSQMNVNACECTLSLSLSLNKRKLLKY